MQYGIWTSLEALLSHPAWQVIGGFRWTIWAMLLRLAPYMTKGSAVFQCIAKLQLTIFVRHN